MKKLKIFSLASEVDPFSKTGGLADVTRSLPKSLRRLGHDVTVFTPLYKKVIVPETYGLKKTWADIKLNFDDNRELTVSYYRGELIKGLPIYFLSCDKYFGRKKNLYGSTHENKRFYIFSVAALKLLELLGTPVDIIHCHDWHAGLVPELLKKKYKHHPLLSSAATVFTIHNLAFQFGYNWWEIPGDKRDNGLRNLPDFNDDKHLERINFTKRAILYSDIVNAVSETYAEEILHTNFGQDLHRILKNRKEKLFGVVNGIDYLQFNPLRDPQLAANYSQTTIDKKQLNKRALQKRLGLAADGSSFVIVMTSRIAEQKGFDILLPDIDPLLQLKTQIIFMGDGDREYAKRIQKLCKQYPDRMALLPYANDQASETMLYAGGDISLFPSRFEPCGTGQLKSFRYGCVPVAREIGGLSDTVSDFDLDRDQGNGFVFTGYDSASLLVAITRAYTHFQHPVVWQKLIVRGMQQSNSWELPARKYLELYRRALRFKKDEKNSLG